LGDFLRKPTFIQKDFKPTLLPHLLTLERCGLGGMHNVILLMRNNGFKSVQLSLILFLSTDETLQPCQVV